MTSRGRGVQFALFVAWARSVASGALGISTLGLVLALTSAGCGSKSSLYEPRPRADAGPVDAYVPPVLEVDCGRATRRVAVGRPFVLRATATSGATITSERWSATEVPAGSAVIVPATGPEVGVTADVAGTYVFTFEAVDETGTSGTCSVEVEATATEIVAICPPEEAFDVGSGEALVLEGDAVDPGGSLVVEWVQTEGPSMASLRVLDSVGAVVEFTATVSGTYVITLRATGASGSDMCEVRVRVTAPPAVVCGDTVTGPTRRPITVSATATDDDLAGVSWSIVSAPDGSTATPSPVDQLSTTITPNVRGDYVLRFTARDASGLEASCDVRVIAQPSGPDAVCPGTIDTRPLTSTVITGSGIDDGMIVSYGWQLLARPPGSSASDPSPANAASTTLLPDLAGEYTLQLTVRDDDGNAASCETLVRAIATEGLRVEVFWNTDGTDMDTHLLRPSGTTWFTDDDCYYGNCPGGLSWPPAGTDDDPALDIDDTDGFGPENINIDLPIDGTYRVGIDAFRGAADVTVRIYCGGSTTEPRQTFGPVRIDSTPNDFWRVADVTTSPGGCTITDLASGGSPNVGPCDGCSR